MSEPVREFLTVAEIADILKMNPQSIRNWIDDGKLPAYRVGRRVRVSRADFDALVETGRTAEPVGGGRAGEASYSAHDFWGGVPLPFPAAG